MVPNMRAVLKKASWGTRRIFRSIWCKKQAFPVRKGHSVHENPLLWYATHLQRPAEQPTPQTVDSLLWYAMRFQGPRCMKTPSCRTQRIFRGVPCPKQHLPHRTHLQCAKQPPLSLFAPAPSTISFVPLTRDLSPEAPSPAPSTALGTRNGLRSEVSSS